MVLSWAEENELVDYFIAFNTSLTIKGDKQEILSEVFIIFINFLVIIEFLIVDFPTIDDFLKY